MGAFTGLAIGVVILAVVIGFGILFLSEIGDKIGDIDPDANATTEDLKGELDSTDGLASWVGLVILTLVIFTLLGFFIGRRRFA